MEHSPIQHNQHSIATSVVSRIEREAIAPTPRWHFLFHELVVWGLGIGAAVLGALAVAAIVYTAQHADWEYYGATHDSLIEFALAVIPYVWITSLLLFAVGAYVSVRHTKRGYRYRVSTLTGSVVVLSVVFGVLLSLSGGGVGKDVDEKIGAFIPLHNTLRETKLSFWNQPERGLVAGVVEEIAENGTITLRTLQGTEKLSTASLDEMTRSSLRVGSAVRAVVPERILPRATRDMRVTATSETFSAKHESSLSHADSFVTTSEDTTALAAKTADLDVGEYEQSTCLLIPLDWDQGFAPKNNTSEEKPNGRSKAVSQSDRDRCIEELRALRGN